jgi:hypothetical protein
MKTKVKKKKPGGRGLGWGFLLLFFGFGGFFGFLLVLSLADCSSWLGLGSDWLETRGAEVAVG